MTEASTSARPRFSRKQPQDRKRQLIDAAIECLAEGGMAAFTVERVCSRTGTSRGLISHHFDGKDDLLAQAYEVMTRHLNRIASVDGLPAKQQLRRLIEANFAAGEVERTQLRAWLAVWGEMTGNPRLLAIHGQRYNSYRNGLADLVSAIAGENGKAVDAAQLATMLIGLIDGLWLEWAIDETRITSAEAERACLALLEPHLGSLGEG